MRNKTCYLLSYMSVIVSFEAFIQLTNLSKLQDPSYATCWYKVSSFSERNTCYYRISPRIIRKILLTFTSIPFRQTAVHSKRM